MVIDIDRSKRGRDLQRDVDDDGIQEERRIIEKHNDHATRMLTLHPSTSLSYQVMMLIDFDQEIYAIQPHRSQPGNRLRQCDRVMRARGRQCKVHPVYRSVIEQ